MSNKNISHARIMQEIRNLSKEKLDYLKAEPLESDIYTWHFTIRGPEGTDFHEGLYHGQILLPFEYPFKPPDIVFNNKNGRFEVGTKICLTITQYHPDEWNSAWTIRTMLEAVISLFNQKVVGVGYVQSTGEARRFWAKSSHDYVCEKCGILKNILKPREPYQKKISQKEPSSPIKSFMRVKSEQVQYRKVQVRRQPKKKIQEQQGSEIKQQKKQPQKVEQSPEKNQPVFTEKKHKRKRKDITPQEYFLSAIQQTSFEYSTVIKSMQYKNI